MCASLPQLALKNCQYICNYSWLAWKKSREETYIEIFDWFAILGCLIAQIFKMEVIIGSRERWDLFESNINQSALEASYYGAFGQKKQISKIAIQSIYGIYKMMVAVGFSRARQSWQVQPLKVLLDWLSRHENRSMHKAKNIRVALKKIFP